MNLGQGFSGLGLGLASGLLAPNMAGAYGSYGNALSGLGNAYNPYVNLGISNMQNFSKEAQNLYNNPVAEQNKLAESFYDSPYQQHDLHQVQGMMNNNAAETGMLGSQSANEHLAQQLTNMQGQFQNQYVNNGLNEFNNAMRDQYMIGSGGMSALNAKNQMMQESALGNLMGGKANAQWQNNLVGSALGLGMAGLEGGLF